mmetsp:Transcript_24091/g.57098  ORF Transcript_24091/g.57098 Transcript_24091/m.57098 type:complete len:359 (+) Transcript_24091:75-1151(+)
MAEPTLAAACSLGRFVSRGDDYNYCRVESVNLLEQEIQICLQVVGEMFDPAHAEIMSLGAVPRRGALPVGEVQASRDGHKVTLSFPASRSDAQELYFRYAPGYSPAFISDLLSSEEHQEASRECEFLFQGEGSWCGADAGQSRLRAIHGVKREDGFQQRVSSRLETAHEADLSCDWAARSEVICSMVEAKHGRVAGLLASRLRTLQALKATWDTGNAAELVKALEACNDDSLAAAFLGRLTQHPQLPAVSLTRLLPLAQRLVQADCEEHAVAAVRFALHSLQVSWPTIAKSLKSIGTSQVLLAACEEAVGQLQSLYSTVKALSRSVKISKTNGPLVPLCKKLKVSLEQALTGVGRLRA